MTGRSWRHGLPADDLPAVVLSHYRRPDCKCGAGAMALCAANFNGQMKIYQCQGCDRILAARFDSHTYGWWAPETPAQKES